MSMEEIIREFIFNYGLISIFVLVLLEYANFPMPSEVVLPLMGVIGVLNDISFIKILIVSVVAGVLGSTLNYILGLYFGPKAINYIISKFPKFKKSIDITYGWFDKYGTLSVLLSRVIPVARTLISLVAGVVRIKPTIFVIFSALGIAIWNSVLIALGFILGNNSALISLVLKRYSILVAIVIVILTIVLIIKNREKIKEKLF